MYAIIVTGGKQFRVKKGQMLKVEKLDSAPGDTVNFDEVLLLGEGNSVRVGSPTVAGAKVSAEVISHGRKKKISIIKLKRRKHHMRRMGHRQSYTEVKITNIEEAA